MSATDLAVLDRVEEIEERTDNIAAEVKGPMDAEKCTRLLCEANELLSEIRELRASLR